MGLGDLPAEMTEHIFQFLSIEDYKKTSMVSKKFYHFSHNGYEKLLKENQKEYCRRVKRARKVLDGQKSVKKILIDLGKESPSNYDCHAFELVLKTRLGVIEAKVEEYDQIIQISTSRKTRFISSCFISQTQTDSADLPSPQTSSPRYNP